MVIFTLSALIGPRFAESAAALTTILEAGPSGVDPTNWLIYNGGSLGVVLLLIITGQIRTKAEVKSKDEQIASLKAENQQQAQLIQAFQVQLTGQTLPALARTAQLIGEVPNSRSQDLGDVKQLGQEVRNLSELLKQVKLGSE